MPWLPLAPSAAGGCWAKAAVGKSQLSEFAGEVRLSLDISQLPRPFQLSALGATDWKLESDWTPMALEGEH